MDIEDFATALYHGVCVSALLLVFFGLPFSLYTVLQSDCPVSKYDRVTYKGRSGYVAVINSGGSLTDKCSVAVRWDNGENTPNIYGWELDKEGGDGQ